jgi:hypothetical protein
MLARLTSKEVLSECPVAEKEQLSKNTCFAILVNWKTPAES